MGVDRKTMILSRNLDLACCQIHHGVVPTMMSELLFECSSPKRECQNLVTEADAENGNFADEFGDDFLGVRNCIGITRTVREKDAVGVHAQNRFRWCPSRNNLDPKSRLDETPQDIELDPVIVSDNEVLWG